MSSLRSKEILGIRVDFGLTMNEVLSKISKEYLQDGKCHHLCTTNSEFIMQASENSDFREIINRADLSVPDSTGVLMAEKFLHISDELKRTGKYNPLRGMYEGFKLGVNILFGGIDIGERITGVELVKRVCEMSNDKGYSVFFLGGWPVNWRGKPLVTNRDIASEAVDKLKKEYPHANIIGASSQFSYKSNDDLNTISYIKACLKKNNLKELDFLLVAYNQYEQEKWIVRNKDRIPTKVSIGVGRSFNYYSNSMKMPPEYITKYHLEWLYTLIKEPWRYKRVLRAFPGFPLRVYINTIKNI